MVLMCGRDFFGLEIGQFIIPFMVWFPAFLGILGASFIAIIVLAVKVIKKIIRR